MKALDDVLQVTEYCPRGVDGVIVAVVHDEFRGMGLSGVQEFMDGGAVVVDVKREDEISCGDNGVFKR